MKTLLSFGPYPILKPTLCNAKSDPYNTKPESCDNCQGKIKYIFFPWEKIFIFKKENLLISVPRIYLEIQ